ncbi:MAG: hypothetical protein ACLP4V_06915 [Methylocella sp.]
MTTKQKTPGAAAHTTLSSRRALLGALAAVPVAAMPMLASASDAIDPDPIFALIEAAERAKASVYEASNIEERLLHQFRAVPRPTAELTVLGMTSYIC